MVFIVSLDAFDWLRHMTCVTLTFDVTQKPPSRKQTGALSSKRVPLRITLTVEPCKIQQTLKLFGSQMIPTPFPAAGCLEMSVVIARRATAWQQSEVVCNAAASLITVVFHQSIVVEEKHSAFCPKRREDAGDVLLLTRR